MKVFKTENGKLYEGEMESIRENKGDCYICGQPVYVSSGQLYKLNNKRPSHKVCRKR